MMVLLKVEECQKSGHKGMMMRRCLPDSKAYRSLVLETSLRQRGAPLRSRIKLYRSPQNSSVPLSPIHIPATSLLLTS